MRSPVAVSCGVCQCRTDRARAAAAPDRGQSIMWARGKPALGVYAPNERPGPGGEGGGERSQAPPARGLHARRGGKNVAQMNPLDLRLQGS